MRRWTAPALLTGLALLVAACGIDGSSETAAASTPRNGATPPAAAVVAQSLTPAAQLRRLDAREFGPATPDVFYALATSGVPVDLEPTARPIFVPRARPTPTPIPTEVPTPEPTPDLGTEGSSADVFDPDGLSVMRSSGFEVLDDPRMVPSWQATWLRGDDVILGVVTSTGEAHAFPVRQMAYHHIANVTVAGAPYLVTY